MNLVLGFFFKKQLQEIGAGRSATSIPSSPTPIDINLAKQLNILLGNLGVPDALIVIRRPAASVTGWNIPTRSWSATVWLP